MANAVARFFLYRRGDGNEGNFPRAIVELAANDDAYLALRALVPNDYIAGKKVRRWIMRTIEIDGEEEHGISAMVMDGPDGETAFGAAYITAELQPLSESDLAYYRDHGTYESPLRKMLDPSALRQYRASLKAD